MGEQSEREFESMLMLRLCGEMTTKSRGIRQKFNRRLVQNLRDALQRAGIEGKVRDEWYRIDIKTDDRRALKIASRIFGIQGASWTQAYKWDSIDDIVEIGETLFAEKVAGKTFAVRTRRSGYRDQIPFTSVDVDRALGTRLCAAGGSVDLDNFEVRVGVEVRKDRAFFFDEEIDGVAGLPGGVEGRALTLMSGGFDSAVAAWTMMRRGVDMDFLFFNLAGPPQEQAVKEVTKRLCERWAFGYAPRFHVVDLRPMIAEMRKNTDGHYWQVLLKRLMFRAGQKIAMRKGYPAMITGVLRPLVGMNKETIIEGSRRIGTYDLCSQIPEFCSLDGGPPVVDATAKALDEQEAKIDLSLLDELVKRREISTVLEMEIEDNSQVQIDDIPEGAIVVDLRKERDFERWYFDGAINMPLERAMEQVLLLPKAPIYLLYCEVGLKSAFLAEEMSKVGYEAYSFAGGVPKLKKYKKRAQPTNS